MSRYSIFQRDAIKFKSVKERRSKIYIEPTANAVLNKRPELTRGERESIQQLCSRIFEARQENKPVVLCMGAHSIKNGACLVINELVSRGFITHVAGNGATAIHDWEFARFGKSTECVRTNVSLGEFGIWEETGQFFGVAAECACIDNQGWGEKIGQLMCEGATFDGGSYKSPDYSVMRNCYKYGIPYTIHPGIGQDIVYSHPTVTGNIGCCINDFLIFCEAIRNLEGGIYLSVGSSVMSPMIFEKALSMSRNVEIQAGREIEDFLMAVNDLADNNWDWSQGEPPMDNPAYYLRFMKSFHRMGGELKYYGVHNIDFLRGIHQCLIQS